MYNGTVQIAWACPMYSVAWIASLLPQSAEAPPLASLLGPARSSPAEVLFKTFRETFFTDGRKAKNIRSARLLVCQFKVDKDGTSRCRGTRSLFHTRSVSWRTFHWLGYHAMCLLSITSVIPAVMSIIGSLPAFVKATGGISNLNGGLLILGS